MSDRYFAKLNSMVPSRAAVERGSPVVSSNALRAWLNNLPLADRSFVMLQMREVLRNFNAALVAPPQRLAMLDMLEHTCAVLVDDVRNEVREFYPQSPERQEEMRLADAIENEMMLGYVEVTCDLCLTAGRIPFMRRSTIAKALVRAVGHQVARLWLALKTHGDPPAGVWQNLHDLFRFAIVAGCADRAVGSATQAAKTSVRSAYTQALLLAFAKPRQLTQAQNRQLYTALPVLGTWCVTRQGHATAGAIMVHTDGDRSPPTMPRGEQVSVDDRWMLDIAALFVRLDQLVANCEDSGDIVLRARHGNGETRLSASLVKTLRRVWSERVTRAAERKTEANRLETEVGLTSMHFILSGNQDFDAVLPLGAETSSSTASWATRSPMRVPARRARAEAVDRSAGGYRLRWNAVEDARARVGDLIAMSSISAHENQWRFGTLRWLRTGVDASVEAGVEWLRKPVPVAVYTFDASGNTRAPMRGILVASNDDREDDSPGILVPRPFADDAAALEIMRIECGQDGPMPRPVRIARFEVRDEGLYQKIVIADDEIARIEGA